MSYAWIIDKDHNPDVDAREGTNANAKGVMGPHDAPDWMFDRLRSLTTTAAVAAVIGTVECYTFELLSGDHEIDYTGRMITDEGQTEDACFGPLQDYGPNAGSAYIRYPGHPDMDCS